MTDRAGMSGEVWEEVLQLINSESAEEKFERWEAATEENKNFLLQRGLWGVPCIRYGKVVVFGQDKLWAIERVLQQEYENGGEKEGNEYSNKSTEIYEAIIKYCSYE